jgi:hypothetical protein
MSFEATFDLSSPSSTWNLTVFDVAGLSLVELNLTLRSAVR